MTSDEFRIGKVSQKGCECALHQSFCTSFCIALQVIKLLLVCGQRLVERKPCCVALPAGEFNVMVLSHAEPSAPHLEVLQQLLDLDLRLVVGAPQRRRLARRCSQLRFAGGG